MNWKGVNARFPHPPHFRSRQFRAGRAYVAAGGQFERHLTAADRDQTAVSVVFHFMKPAVPCREWLANWTGRKAGSRPPLRCSVEGVPLRWPSCGA
jgi:hypothetical protein